MFYELPENTPNHGGEEVNSKYQFFGEPPAEIGTLLTAQSNLKKHAAGATMGRRLGKAFLTLTIFAIIATAIGIAISYPALQTLSFTSVDYYKTFWESSAVLYFILVVLVGLPTALVVFLKSKQSCTYVGDKGTYEVSYGSSKGKLFSFETAEEIRVGRTEQYYNGVYSGTNYNYHWRAGNGRRVHAIKGQYRQRNGVPKKLNDPFYFAESASSSWNNYCFEKMRAKLNSGESVTFNTGATLVRIGLEQFSITHKKKQLDWSICEIEGIQVNQGIISIFNSKHADMGYFAKMFGQGVVSFPYASTPNAQILLMLMDGMVNASAKTVQAE